MLARIAGVSRLNFGRLTALLAKEHRVVPPADGVLPRWTNRSWQSDSTWKLFLPLISKVGD